MPARQRKRVFDTADLVDDDEETEARKMSCCPMCRIQDGYIDPANRATGRIKLVGGVDDYCFTLLLLVYNVMEVKDVQPVLLCVFCAI